MKKKIPHPLAQQVTAQSISLTASLGTGVLTSTTFIGTNCPHPEPSFEVLALKYIG